MNFRTLITALLTFLAPSGLSWAGEIPPLPNWQVLEYEERAFWAVARSRLELTESETEAPLWCFTADSSIPSNSEFVTLHFDPASGQLLTRNRLSHGKEDQRLKFYDYGEQKVTRERRSPGSDTTAVPKDWPVESQVALSYPEGAQEDVVISPYMLLILAQRLQAQGPGHSREVMVHTDMNFYRARLTSGDGIAVDVNYTVGQEGATVTGRRDTLAVALRVTPAGDLAEEDDFSVLGLYGDIILLFDKETGLPLQIRGEAPRIGPTEINLKAVTMRPTDTTANGA